MTNPDELELMQSIKTKWGAKIDAACKTSSVPPAFLAALIANESGGDLNAKRFEPSVLIALWNVLAGRKTAFGSIGHDAIIGSVVAAAAAVAMPPYGQAAPISAALQQLDSLATSWGLTQVMGYYALDPSIGGSLLAIRTPEGQLALTLRRLAQCTASFDLDLTKDFEAMLRCWNGGHPTAATADPQYVPNGLARLAIYEGLA